MRRGLASRLERLEGVAAIGRAGSLPLIYALLEHPFPDDADKPIEWAREVLRSFDYPDNLIVDVVPGTVRNVLIPPTDYDAIAYRSPEERLIQQYCYAFPQFQIVGSPSAFMLKRERSFADRGDWEEVCG